jgi:MFS family permease
MLAPLPSNSSFRNGSKRPVRQNLRASAADGAAFGGMVGMGETYLAAFALAMGSGEIASGLVASLPVMAGGIMQLVSLRAVRWIGSEKRWILLCATLQALSFIPLVYAAFRGTIPTWVLFAVASIYWGTGLATGPAWSSWIETVVPAGVRMRYFASRSRLAQLTTLSGFLMGGAALTIGRWLDQVPIAFAVMFASACVLRLMSVYALSRHQSLERPTPAKSIADAESSATSRGVWVHSGRLLMFLVVLQGMVQVSGPFFTPYMLKELDFSYLQYVSLISISFVSKAFSLSAWAHLTKRTNAKVLLWIGSIGLVPLAGLWTVSTQFTWLLFVQTLSGVLWAAYELGFFLMFFEVLPKDRRIRMLTVYNFANSSAIFMGASVGATILWFSGSGVTGYWTLFALSSVGRLFALGILASASLGTVPIAKIAVRVLGLRAGNASLDSPVIPALNEARELVAIETAK